MKHARLLSAMMCVLVSFATLAAMLVPTAQARTRSWRPQPGFVALDVYVDAGNVPLAAYQFEFTAPGAKLVGIEGGESSAFAQAPYYDPRALADDGAPGQGERIVVAAFSTQHDLPNGRTRVARLHLNVPAANAQINHEIMLITAGDANGRQIKATVKAVRGVNGAAHDDEGDAR